MNYHSQFPTPVPKIIDHDRYRAELLVKCFDLFTSQGYVDYFMQSVITANSNVHDDKGIVKNAVFYAEVP